MRFTFEIEKAAQVVAFFLQQNQKQEMSILKLLKLLYIADRESLRKCGFPITGDRAVAMEHGPVLSGIYDYIKLADDWQPCTGEERFWRAHFLRQGKKLCLKKSPGQDRLTENDVSILNNVVSRFAKRSAAQLRNLTHQFPEWRKNEVGSSSASIPLGDILDAIGLGEHREEIEQARHEEAYFDKLFAP